MLVSNVQVIAWDEYEGAGSSLGEDEKKSVVQLLVYCQPTGYQQFTDS